MFVPQFGWHSDHEWIFVWLICDIAKVEFVSIISRNILRDPIGQHDAEKLRDQIQYCDVRERARLAELAIVFGNDCY